MQEIGLLIDNGNFLQIQFYNKMKKKDRKLMIEFLKKDWNKKYYKILLWNNNMVLL
jgi:hypothetical protein